MGEEPLKKAEYNMGALDYERLSITISTANQAVVILLNDTYIQNDPSLILFAVGAVYAVYRELRRFLYESSNLQDYYDGRFQEVYPLALNEVDKNKAVITSIREMQRSEADIRVVDCPFELYKKISDLYDEILELKHKLGFDVPTKEKRDIKKELQELEDFKWPSKNTSPSS
ncbi:MAG: hypothetical protein NT130_05835 [Candidatus Micrarchaeota archaeon]|nr:hypothetical protein [Candidatus Micrarchaeota archaeon]